METEQNLTVPWQHLGGFKGDTLFKVLSTVPVPWSLSDKPAILGCFGNFSEMTLSWESNREMEEVVKSGIEYLRQGEDLS